MGEFLNQPFVGCDLIFDNNSLSPFMIPVIASGTALPFREGEFETVLCLDSFEHVASKHRSAFVGELLRITRSILIIGAPMGEKGSVADKRLHNYYSLMKTKEPLWLEEHIALIEEFPRANDLENIFHEAGVNYEVRKGESALFHIIISVLETLRVTGRISRILSLRPWRYLLSPFLRMMNNSGTYRTYFIIKK
jgi:hypothetical protein